jgi:putative transposase
VKDEVYHLYNRGVARMPMFTKPSEFLRFIHLIEYCHFANTPVSFSLYKKRTIEKRKEILQTLYEQNDCHVEIMAFCLMNNHFHLLIRQMTENGSTKFIGNIQNGYGKFFNMKHKRTGPVFQPGFQAVRVETDEQLLHVSRYIHLNPTTAYIVKSEELDTYQWSSLPGYLDGNKCFSFVSMDTLLGLINGENAYKTFTFDQASYQQELGRIKHLVFE